MARIPDIINDPTLSELEALEAELVNGVEKLVQFSKAPENGDVIPKLDKLCAVYGNQLIVRFYAYYFKAFDGQILDAIPNVTRLHIDLRDAVNLEFIASLSNLIELNLSVYKLPDKEILNTLPLEKLVTFGFGEAKSKAVNLEYLERCKQIQCLSIFGHKKNISVIERLTTLENLTLNPSISIPLDFINKLPKLEELGLFLGSKQDINEIHLAKLKLLRIIRIRSLETIGDLARFPKLERLYVEDQLKINTISFSDTQKKLQHIHLHNCKNLLSLEGLEKLPSLQSIDCVRTKIDIDELLNNEFSETLTNIRLANSNRKLEEQITTKINAAGYFADRSEAFPWN